MARTKTKGATPAVVIPPPESRMEAVRSLGEAVSRLATDKGDRALHVKIAADDVAAAIIVLGPAFISRVVAQLAAEAAISGGMPA